MIEIDSFSQSRIEMALKKLETFAASDRIAFSSYTHAAFDQEARILTGDIRWKAFAQDAASLGCELYPLVWEMQPPGFLNEITFLIPDHDHIGRTRIKSGFSTVCWWAKADPQAIDRIASGVLNKDKWLSSRNALQKGLNKQYPAGTVDSVIGRYDYLRNIFEQAFTTNFGCRLSGISENIYQRLSQEIFGELAESILFNRQSYFGSGFADQLAAQALEGLREGWFEDLIVKFRLTGKNIFIGGSFGAPFMVARPATPGIYTKRPINMRSGDIIDGQRVEKEELVELLATNVIRPTGYLFDALLLRGFARLVVHDGNDYGSVARARALIDVYNQQRDFQVEYCKLFPDNKDSLAPIAFTAGSQTEIASLVSLYLWDLNPFFWSEKLIQAAREGVTQNVNISKEVVR